MIYSELKSKLIEISRYGERNLTTSTVLEMLKNKKQEFEWFLTNFGTLDDTAFLIWYKKFFALHMADVRQKYYNEKYDWPVSSIVKVDDYVKRFYDEEGGYYKCEYSIIHDIDFDMEDRVYTKEELAELKEQGKIIIELTNLAYGPKVSEEEIKDKTFGIFIEPFKVSEKYLAKTLRQELTEPEIKKAHKLFVKYYDMYLQLIKQKAKNKEIQK